MSEYCDVRTTFKNEDALVCALVEMGKWTREQIERHAEAVNLVGYQNDTRAQKAHVVIRKQFVGGASNDIGFERQADGSYVAHISAFDRGSRGYNDAWLKQVKQHYVYHTVRLQQEARGRTVWRERLPNGRQLLTIRGYR